MEEGPKTPEDIYGMSIDELNVLIESQGYDTPNFEANDPDFDKKHAAFSNRRKSFDQADVMLFDRVLSGEATEEELVIAENHAITLVELTYGLNNHGGDVPFAWLTNDRLSAAMENTSPENKRMIENIKKNYTKEQLIGKHIRKIDENGVLQHFTSR